MIGEKIQDIAGKITGTRVLPGDIGSVKVEVSYAGTGKLLGMDTTESGTYQSQAMPSGFLYGQGQGVTMGKDGEVATWRGFGVGKPTGKGMGASYRYSISFQSTSPRWARLNGMLLVGEWEVDENGNTRGSGWEWK